MIHDIRPGAVVRLVHSGKILGNVCEPDGHTFAVEIKGHRFWVPIAAIWRLEDGEIILDPARLEASVLNSWRDLLNQP
jgi:hypothetical protein